MLVTLNCLNLTYFYNPLSLGITTHLESKDSYEVDKIAEDHDLIKFKLGDIDIALNMFTKYGKDGNKLTILMDVCLIYLPIDLDPFFFDNLPSKVSDVMEQYPNASIVLVGVDVQNRFNPQVLKEAWEKGYRLLDRGSGDKLANRIGAIKYVEYDVKSGKGLQILLDEVACTKLWESRIDTGIQASSAHSLSNFVSQTSKSSIKEKKTISDFKMEFVFKILDEQKWKFCDDDTVAFCNQFNVPDSQHNDPPLHFIREAIKNAYENKLLMYYDLIDFFRNRGKEDLVKYLARYFIPRLKSHDEIFEHTSTRSLSTSGFKKAALSQRRKKTPLVKEKITLPRLSNKLKMTLLVEETETSGSDSESLEDQPTQSQSLASFRSQTKNWYSTNDRPIEKHLIWHCINFFESKAKTCELEMCLDDVDRFCRERNITLPGNKESEGHPAKCMANAIRRADETNTTTYLGILDYFRGRDLNTIADQLAV